MFKKEELTREHSSTDLCPNNLKFLFSDRFFLNANTRPTKRKAATLGEEKRRENDEDFCDEYEIVKNDRYYTFCKMFNDGNHTSRGQTMKVVRTLKHHLLLEPKTIRDFLNTDKVDILLLFDKSYMIVKENCIINMCCKMNQHDKINNINKLASDVYNSSTKHSNKKNISSKTIIIGNVIWIQQSALIT